MREQVHYPDAKPKNYFSSYYLTETTRKWPCVQKTCFFPSSALWFWRHNPFHGSYHFWANLNRSCSHLTAPQRWSCCDSFGRNLVISEQILLSLISSSKHPEYSAWPEQTGMATIWGASPTTSSLTVHLLLLILRGNITQSVDSHCEVWFAILQR